MRQAGQSAGAGPDEMAGAGQDGIEVPYSHSNSFHHAPPGFLIGNGVYIADLRFTCIRKILSLPPYHGARWTAWLRNACAKAGCMWEDLFAALLPFRSGARPILPGEELVVRLILIAPGLRILAKVLSALPYTRAEGEFSSLSLRLSGVTDAVAGAPVSIMPGGGAELEPFTADLAKDEAQALMRGHCHARAEDAAAPEPSRRHEGSPHE